MAVSILAIIVFYDVTVIGETARIPPFSRTLRTRNGVDGGSSGPSERPVKIRLAVAVRDRNKRPLRRMAVPVNGTRHLTVASLGCYSSEGGDGKVEF